jgi:hypothetical protein
MIKSLILTSLAFLTLGSGDASPDRCAQLGSDGYPLFCSPAGPDAPWWGEEVCCDGANCSEPGTAGCPENTRNYSCEYAELDAVGRITCLFSVERYCDTHECEAPPASAPGYAPQPEAFPMCCYEQGCYSPQGAGCGGIMYWCDDGVTNESGTVTCFDGGNTPSLP